MYEKILVPLDGSKRAEMIRPHVRELASRFKATAIFLRVIKHTYTNGIGETYSGISEKAFDAKLKESESYLDGLHPSFGIKVLPAKRWLPMDRK